MLKDQIAECLEREFSLHGFAQPSVSQLQKACKVSLRTMYKYFPSKETMIVGALAYRHQRYLSFLIEGIPKEGLQAVSHIFNRLEQWMEQFAPHGCLSIHAIAAFPENSLITDAVQDHKIQVKKCLAKQIQNEELADLFFLLHEGVSNAWPFMGKQAVISAEKIIKQQLGDK